MHAVLLAGGKGTRLQPLTSSTPKSLLPLAGMSVIDRLIAQLVKSGVDELTIATGHLSSRIQMHLGPGKTHGATIRYLEESRPLDTAGCLGQLDSPHGNFLVVNADIVTDFRFEELFNFHRRLDAAATVAVRRHRVSLDFGAFDADDDGNMLSYVEKPDVDFWIGMGIYCFSPRACEFVARDERVSMPQLLTRLHDANELVRCYRAECSWFDIGRHESYSQAEEYCRTRTRVGPLRRAA